MSIWGQKGLLLYVIIVQKRAFLETFYKEKCIVLMLIFLFSVMLAYRYFNIYGKGNCDFFWAGITDHFSIT